MGIFVFIARETYPLFLGAEWAQEQSVLVGAGQVRAETPLKIGTDPYREIAYTIHARGIDFIARDGGELLQSYSLGEIIEGDSGGARATAATRSPRDGRIAVGLADGQTTTARIRFDLSYGEDGRSITPVVEMEETFRLFDGVALEQVAYRNDGSRWSAVAGLSADGRLVVRVAERARSLIGPGRLRQARFDLTDQVQGGITALAIDDAVEHVVIGTNSGRVQVWRLQGTGNPPERLPAFDVTQGSVGGVTALSFLLGDLSIVVGDSNGDLTVWFQADAEGSARAFRRVHKLRSSDDAITVIEPSARDKQFLTGDAGGRLALHHATSEQTFFDLQIGDGPVSALVFAPKADGFLGFVQGEQTLAAFSLHNPHPEVTLTTLFGRVWYEGYEEPEYVWQSTGGTDEFEPKLSMIPLAFGTIKGTVFAMLFALPMAVLAALYTAEFASPKTRNRVKPIVEIMASLPSVILGFLAGLWLAPMLEKYIVGTALLLLLTPVVVVLGAYSWRQLPRNLRMHLPVNAELLVLILLTLGSAMIALALGPDLERLLFGGALPVWLAEETSLRYDQRNCLVIGFAMGFAVIPLIFTICEDALSSVPTSLRAASLGLGATRWQTAVRVVLPMALPGIFSAAMIGFGRAVGETMIVLMATGNTPVLDWNVFTGMRTISANIAVELPEAPHQGTLYRILFFSGLLLFFVTFAVNTVAESVRQRLREKYRRV